MSECGCTTRRGFFQPCTEHQNTIHDEIINKYMEMQEKEIFRLRQKNYNLKNTLNEIKMRYVSEDIKAIIDEALNEDLPRSENK